ncbi:MAG: hypothetical protein RRA15_02915 [bacterium]|nr:hypothetical protein [bacterium]
MLDRTFAVEIKSASSADRLIPAIKRLKSLTYERSDVIPVLAVPFMGETGRELCAREQINWFDLSGNIHLDAPGIRIIIEGKPNQFKKRGRPINLFAPRSSRIVRILLLNPGMEFTQSDLVGKSGLNKGSVSRIVRRMVESDLLSQTNDGKYHVNDPSQLLSAWYDKYDFEEHRIVRGHVPSRTGEELLKKLVSSFKDQAIPCWATGLAAAWLYTHHAMFRIASVYLKEVPDKQALKSIGFVDDPEGANTWLIIPKDDGVLADATEKAGTTCVSPLQTYLDLKGHPERAKEASKELRKQYLSWSLTDA